MLPRSSRSCSGANTPGLRGLVSFGDGAEEAVQEAFVKALVRWSHVGKLEDPAGWVRRVAVRQYPGNEWKIAVGSEGLSLHLSVRQRPDTFVRTAVFQVRTRDWDHVVKHFPTHDNWEPGRHDVRIAWDGRDDAGQLLTPGVYSFTLGARVDSQRRVTCADGSGAGIERFEGGGEGYGLGKFAVDHDGSSGS